MRYIEVTHTYAVGIPDLAADDPSFDSVCNSGVSMMEAHIQEMFEKSKEIKSDWKLMPREYQPGEDRTVGKVPTILDPESSLAKYAIENDLDQGINFTSDVMGQRPGGPGHPWKQGLFIFPEGHPLREVEELMRERADKKGLELLQAQSPKLKELPPGE